MSLTSFAQVVIEERVEIGTNTIIDNKKENFSLNDTTSNIIMWANGKLKVYYSMVTHFDWEMPNYSTLNMYHFKDDSTRVDSLVPKVWYIGNNYNYWIDSCLQPPDYVTHWYWGHFMWENLYYDYVQEGDTIRFTYFSDDIRSQQPTEFGILGKVQGYTLLGNYDECINDYDNVLEIYIDIMPGELFVSIEPEVLYPGDTANVLIRKKFPDGTFVDFDTTQTFEVGMLEGCMSGKLLVGTPPDTGSYFYNVHQPIKFAAADTLVGDSTGTVIIQVGVVDSVEERINREKSLSGIMPDGVKKRTKAKHPEEKADSDAPSIFCFNPAFWQTGEPVSDTATIKKNTILLGETKYFQSKRNTTTGKIKIEEIEPDENGFPQQQIGTVNGWEWLTTDVWGNNPVSVVECDSCGNKLGVYWEKAKPMLNGQNLPASLIRLVGRYWHEDSTYIVKLSAIKDVDTAYVNVTVKKPKKLGDIDSTSIDVFGDTVYVDNLCIEWGGELGIPPHFIKGQMKSETSVCSPFNPTYVFEPYTTQFNILKDYTYHSNQFFVQNDQTTFNPPVPNHLNVKDFTYYMSPTTVWQILEDHSELVNLISGCGQRKYGTRKQTSHSSREDGILDFYGVYSYPQSKYDEYKNNAYKKYDVENHSNKEAQANNEARDSLVNYLKNEWDGGVKDGKKGLINIKAQTRMGASYGLLQMLYTTAREDFNYPLNTVPEFLNEPDGTVYSKNKLEKHLKDLIKSENSANDWTLGLEGSFKKYIWHKWNPGWAQYPKKVLENVMLYKEVSE